MRPYIANQLLRYIKSNNEFYSDIEVYISHISFSLIAVINLNHVTPVEVDWSDQDCDLSFETDHDSFIEVYKTRVESEENPLDLYWIAAN